MGWVRLASGTTQCLIFAKQVKPSFSFSRDCQCGRLESNIRDNSVFNENH